MTVREQFLSWWLTVACGIGLGAVFDLYRVIQWRLRLGRAVVTALDLLLLSTAALGVFWVLYRVNGGVVRAHTFLGLAAGAVFYGAALSAPMVRGWGMLLALVGRVLWGLMWCLDVVLVRPAAWTVQKMVVGVELVLLGVVGLAAGVGKAAWRVLAVLWRPARKGFASGAGFARRTAKIIWRWGRKPKDR